MSNSTRTLSISETTQLAKAAFLKSGCDEANADALSNLVALAESNGAHSHGLFRIPGYIAGLKSGKVNGKAQPKIETVTPSLLRVDCDHGYAPLAHNALAQPLADAAKENGVAVAALYNCFHFAALWVEVELLAKQGVAALACTAFKPAIPPAGGKTPLYGTNPLAFAWPRPGLEPVVFDQASAVKARGEVMIAAREGHELEPGVGIGPDGQATTDPNEVLKGALLPFGGYKGASIAMMIELLAGPLIGEQMSYEAARQDNNDGGPPRGGEFILALAPGRISGGDYASHAQGLFEMMMAQEGVRLPGDGRRAKREKIAREGISVPTSLYDTIYQMGQ